MTKDSCEATRAMNFPTIVIHGGAGHSLREKSRESQLRIALQEILDQLWQELAGGAGAVEIAERGCLALEDCEHFNAGLGSKIQSDGQVRMSASLMDGVERSFSGVVNVEGVQHPTKMAAALQEERDRVIDGVGGAILAREMRLPIFDPVVERQLQRWWKEKKHQYGDGAARAEDDDVRSGTVGVVVCDSQGRLAASTSTGGRGFERIGRISDTATVAGNYATECSAVSCTGIGEDIVDEALAARIVVSTDDGMSLDEAMDRAMAGARQRTRRLAAIGVDRQGNMKWGKTTELLLAVGRTDGQVRWAF